MSGLRTENKNMDQPSAVVSASGMWSKDCLSGGVFKPGEDRLMFSWTWDLVLCYFIILSSLFLTNFILSQEPFCYLSQMSVKTEPDENSTQLPWEQPLVTMTTLKKLLPKPTPPLHLTLSGRSFNSYSLLWSQTMLPWKQLLYLRLVEAVCHLPYPVLCHLLLLVNSIQFTQC